MTDENPPVTNVPMQITSWRREADEIWPPIDEKDVRNTRWIRATSLRACAAQIEKLYDSDLLLETSRAYAKGFVRGQQAK